MIDFIKKLLNKVFKKEDKLLIEGNEEQEVVLEIKNEISKNSISCKEDEDMDMYDYLIGIMKSCDNYEEYKESEMEVEKNKEKMAEVMNYLENKLT